MKMIENDYVNEYSDYLVSLENLLIKNSVFEEDEMLKMRNKFEHKYKNNKLEYLNSYCDYLSKKISDNNLNIDDL
jgi:hypothetical protein